MENVTIQTDMDTIIMVRCNVVNIFDFIKSIQIIHVVSGHTRYARTQYKTKKKKCSYLFIKVEKVQLGKNGKIEMFIFSWR